MASVVLRVRVASVVLRVRVASVVCVVPCRGWRGRTGAEDLDEVAVGLGDGHGLAVGGSAGEGEVQRPVGEALRKART